MTPLLEGGECDVTRDVGIENAFGAPVLQGGSELHAGGVTEGQL